MFASNNRSAEHKSVELDEAATLCYVRLHSSAGRASAETHCSYDCRLLVARDGVRTVHSGGFCVAHVARDDCATADVKSVAGTFEAAVSLRGRQSKRLGLKTTANRTRHRRRSMSLKYGSALLNTHAFIYYAIATHDTMFTNAVV